ncbi:MAG: RNA 2',3'-cyclic phosphodiesterase [Syntrophomonadaceae bacterium]
MRAFIAIQVPDFIRDLGLWVREKMDELSPDVKWVEYENYHITLKFLGEIKNEEYKKIENRLKLVRECCPPFNLQVKGIGFFPNRRRPRVIWLGIFGEIQKAIFLGDRVDAYLSTLGFEPEKEHRFHFTLGRIRSEKNLSELISRASRLDPEVHSELFPIEHFSLMESRLTSDGPRYNICKTFDLKG